jgi:hypothetical protein
VDSSDSSMLQRTDSLGLNESLFCRCLGPDGLCHKEIFVDGHLVLVVNWLYEMGGRGHNLDR